MLATSAPAADLVVLLHGVASSHLMLSPLAAGLERDGYRVVNLAYSIQLSSVNVDSGNVLAEIYDGTTAFNATTPRLINLSARFDVNSPLGGGPLTAGFVVGGSAACTVLLRGVGPALAQFGVTNALADPLIALFRNDTRVAENDNWSDAPNAVALASAAARVGAFALPVNSRDAALLLSLPPGNYSVQVVPASSGAGNALVEIYEVP